VGTAASVVEQVTGFEDSLPTLLKAGSPFLEGEAASSLG